MKKGGKGDNTAPTREQFDRRQADVPGFVARNSPQMGRPMGETRLVRFCPRLLAVVLSCCNMESHAA